VYKPVEKSKRNHEMVIDQLKTLILKGSLKPGDRLLPERELSELLNVSRTSIREALKILEALDLVYVKPGEGTYLKKPTMSGIITPLSIFMQEDSSTNTNLFETRTLLESGIARLAAERRTDEDLQEMELCCHLIQDSKQLEDVIDADIRFHSRVTAASKNPTLHSFASLISELIKHGVRKTRETLFTEPEANEISAKQHFDIYNAIRDRDPDAAYKAMFYHLEYTANQSIMVQTRSRT
jgi:GntR family transcriptional repressor for pyruvate dehydrogenase complex